LAQAAVTLLAALLALAVQSQSGASLPPWTTGTLDIHQIATGRGNAALVVLPDGTTVLVDAGPGGDVIASYIEHALAPVRPFESLRIAPSNVEGRQAQGGPARLDYAVLTHFHSDHVGGIADVEARVPIARMIDRGDEYLRPVDGDPTYTQYRKFLASRGIARETIRVGRADQIVARHDAALRVEVRAVAANGEVWTGHGDETARIFPPLDSLKPEDRPSENMCSIGLRLTYGRFDFFTGGDMPGVPDAGAPAWQSVETAVARAIGPTDVHVVNHHGSIDPESDVFLRTLRSPVMIVPAWSPTHPSQDVLKRMMAARLYGGPHDIFVTTFRAETKASIGARADQVKADHGHIVVRVAPGGDSYRVFVLDEASPSPTVLSEHGPYTSF
jgi:beta-lactamase superfamily II metal-dependent hydrolase